MLNYLTQKQKIIFIIILIPVLCIIIYYIYLTLYLNTNNDYSENTLIISDLIENTNINTTEELFEPSYIVVYICGAVKNNKVITLKENSRICDAIDAVGGLTKDADLTNINLANMLEDGEKIYIPKKGEYIENNINSSYTNLISSNKININKATQTELETIPGIGPSTALKIIKYRNENGKFSKIEDIQNVSGIGTAKFNTIKEYICIK